MPYPKDWLIFFSVDVVILLKYNWSDFIFTVISNSLLQNSMGKCLKLDIKDFSQYFSFFVQERMILFK